jgi:hypothetical protein
MSWSISDNTQRGEATMQAWLAKIVELQMNKEQP